MKHYLAYSFLLFTVLSSCSPTPADNHTKDASVNLAENNTVAADDESPAFDVKSTEVKTFEVKDSSGKSQGWGYDIYINNQRTIHQPIIPAIEGNHSFKTEADAFKTGTFAANKLKATGSLPRLSIGELDSLGITKK